ncbi:hypothetical protein [Paeniglutamicibacter cryotolerans]|uniref:hypothetical protein n=1 Tax=Paeniglutamicibacter cryotolerans TaxID=670079 RepID=UPI0031E9D85C
MIIQDVPPMLGLRVALAGGRVIVESAPPGCHDLGFLAPAFNQIRELVVFDPGILNANAICSMRHLSQLNVREQSPLTVAPPVSVSSLREVAMMWCPSASSLVGLPRLTHLSIDAATNEAMAMVTAKLSSLVLGHPRFEGPVALPRATHKVAIDGLAKLDVGALRFACLPHALQLHDIGTVTGLETLPTGLRSLTLHRVGSLGATRLQDIPVDNIDIQEGPGLLNHIRHWNNTDPEDLQERLNMDQQLWSKLAQA